MPSKITRKILGLGNSGVISIPKGYRDYHNLQPGTTVTVLFDGLILIIPEDRLSELESKKELIDKLLH